MKFISNIALLIALLYSCKSEPKRNFTNLNYLAADKPAIVLSCFRCGCIDDELSKIDTGIFSKYIFFGDTGCYTKRPRSLTMYHISQKKLDTLSADLYSMLVIKKSGDTFSYTIIDVNNSAKMTKILSRLQ
jgi:hypothetical protein